MASLSAGDAREADRSSFSSIWPYLWRSQWRRTSGHRKWAGVDGVATALWLVFLAERLVPLAGAARDAMATDPAGSGIVLASRFLAALQLLWVATFFTMGGALSRAGGFSTQHLMHLPIRERSLLAIACAAILSQPLSWGYGLLSFCALPVLVAGPFPLLGALAFLAHFALMVAVGIAAPQVNAALARSRRASAIVAVVFVLAVCAVALLAPRNLVSAQEVHRWATQTPAGWAARAAVTGEWVPIALLLVASGAVTAFGFVVFTRTYRRPVSSSRRVQVRSWLPAWFDRGPLRAAVRKEVLYLGRSHDVRVSAVISVSGAALLFLYRDPLPWVPMVLFPLLAYLQLGIPHNSFGFDGKNVDRYRLLPLTGRSIVLSKNLAYLGWIGIEVLPLGLACLFRLGAGAALGCIFALFGFAFWTLVWGNPSSIAVPAPRGLGTSDSTDQVGGMALLALASLVLAGELTLVVAAWQEGVARFVIASAAFAAPGVVLWWLLLSRNGRSFDRQAESMRAQLT